MSSSSGVSRSRKLRLGSRAAAIEGAPDPSSRSSYPVLRSALTHHDYRPQLVTLVIRSEHYRWGASVVVAVPWELEPSERRVNAHALNSARLRQRCARDRSREVAIRSTECQERADQEVDGNGWIAALHLRDSRLTRTEHLR
jgi:hypothetical protein